jgi:hypothetical protein
MLWRSVIASLPVALALASCSDRGPGASARGAEAGADGGDGAQDNSAAPGDRGTTRAKRDICTTLDYGHERSNEDYFLQFDDDAAAMAYSKDFLEANNISAPTEMARDARLLRLVGRIFEGFRKVFPSETAGMNKPPRIIAVKTDGINAFAGFDERKEVNKAPWIFWVHQPTIDSTKPDAELEGLYAHELAHLILRNMLPETRSKIRTHYRVIGRREKGVIGAVEPDDDTVRGRAEDLRALGSLVGREAVFGALPVSAFEDNEYQSMLATLAKDRRQAADLQACQTADNGVARVKDYYRDNVSVHDLTLELTPTQTKELTTLAGTTSDALRRCYANVKKSLLELKIEDRSVSVLVNGEPASRETLLDPTTQEHRLVYSVLMKNDVERDLDKKTDLTTIERLLQVVGKLHRRVADLDDDRSLPIDELRVFDLEEDADDAAVRILRAIGDDPQGAARLFMGQLPDPASCARDIEDGKIPRYGRFIDPHNATCWRAFHSIDLANTLERCPTVPPQKSGDDQSPSAALPANPNAMRLVQRPRPLRVR